MAGTDTESLIGDQETVFPRQYLLRELTSGRNKMSTVTVNSPEEDDVFKQRALGKQEDYEDQIRERELYLKLTAGMIEARRVEYTTLCHFLMTWEEGGKTRRSTKEIEGNDIEKIRRIFRRMQVKEGDLYERVYPVYVRDALPDTQGDSG